MARQGDVMEFLGFVPSDRRVVAAGGGNSVHGTTIQRTEKDISDGCTPSISRSNICHPHSIMRASGVPQNEAGGLLPPTYEESEAVRKQGDGVHVRREDRGSIFDRYYASSVGPSNLQRIRKYGGCVATGGGAAWGAWGRGCREYRPTFGVYGPVF